MFLCSETPDLRAIIFCKLRDLTVALERWMQEDQDLKPLKATQLVGARASVEKGGVYDTKDFIVFAANIPA